MARLSKEEIARLEGMKMAYEIAKEHGIEGLEAEIKWRGALNICPQVKANKIMEIVQKLDDMNRLKLGAASAWALSVKMSLPVSMLEMYMENMNERLNMYQKDMELYEEDVKFMSNDGLVIKMTEKFKKEELKDGSYRIIKKG